MRREIAIFFGWLERTAALRAVFAFAFVLLVGAAEQGAAQEGARDAVESFLCSNAGWGAIASLNGAVACSIPVEDATSGETHEICAFTGTLSNAPQCTEVFGDPVDFPSNASHQSGTRYVHNCPAPTVPDAARTGCVCPQTVQGGGACEAALCALAGWGTDTVLSHPDLPVAFCKIPLLEGANNDFWESCAFSNRPDYPRQCSDIFGSPPDFPKNRENADRYVFNCPGIQVPNANQTACVCPHSSYQKVDGACVCAVDQAEVNGQCVACGSSPNHHLRDGVCRQKAVGDAGTGSCPAGETLISGVDALGDFKLCVLDEFADDVNNGKTACESAGWHFIAFGNSRHNDAICQIPIRQWDQNQSGLEFETFGFFCSFTDNLYSGFLAFVSSGLRCKDVFGDPLNFPSATGHPYGDAQVYEVDFSHSEWFYASCPGVQMPSADLKSCVCDSPHKYVLPNGECPWKTRHVSSLCEAAGWSVNDSAFLCNGPKRCDATKTGNDRCDEACYISVGGNGPNHLACQVGFGDPPVFPAINSAEQAAGIIRNCEQLTPPRVRSADRTECVCDAAAGYMANKNDCITLSGAEDFCRNAGWEVSVVDGATVCGVPLLDVTNDARSSFCRLSAGGERRCADLFDGLQNIPRKVPNESISYVHNCLGIQRPTDDFKRCDCRNGNRYTYPNGDCPYKIPLIRHLCEQAGWSRDGHFCVGPKSCDAQATGGGRCDDRCFITREMESRAGRPSCHVFGERPPVFPHNNLLERDLQVIYNCPFPKEPGADRTECVCPERFKETPDGTCSFCGHNQVAGADGLSCVCDSAHAQTSTLPDGGPFCAPLVSCDFPFVPNHLGVSCNCAAGYELLDGACVDVDECKPESGNCAGPGQYGFGRSCYNREGGFACHDCEEGTGPTPDGRWCRDVNECALGTDTCGANSVCHNVVNTFSCGCEAGYVPGPGGSSRDPQCAVPDPDASPCAAAQASSCGAHASCHSFGEDGFSCSCDAGYASGNDGTSQSPQCRNVDECISGDVCGGNAQCSDAEGSYACECDAGFASGSPGDLQRPQCGDVDECGLRTDSCGSGQACENTFGSYECVTCTTGSAPNAHRTDCAPIFAGTPPPPGVPVAALLPAVQVLLKWLPPTNLGGGVITRYEVLREEDESDGFVFLSSVAAAFTGGPSFTDLEPPFGATVRYKVRAVNFDLSLGALSEASEAVAIPPDVYTEANCLAKGGSWGRIASRPGNEHHAAADTCTVGGGTCFMNPEANFDSGASTFYEADGVSRGVHEYPVSGWCLDAWPLDCSPKILADPDNPFGGCIAYDCPSGHEANRTRTACEDVDECARGTHECAAGVGVCANTAGAYACGCGEGYSGDGYICTADKRVSLLAAANGSLSASPDRATVSHGTTVTFTAAPASGYEVSVWLADCVGSSGLECALTVTLDVSVGVEFSDIDECALETHSCAAEGGVCANTAGSYSCDCVSGYSGDGSVCEADKRVSLLAAVHGSLSADPAEATVSHGTTVTFTAAPASGYEVSVWLADCVGSSGLECALTVTLDVSVGVEFSDIDECALETHSCAAGGVCTNTAGAYNCDCVSGYSGDGSVCESDRRVSLLAVAHGSLSADPDRATVSHGTTVTFTAAPASGYEVSVWLADCVGSLGLECALTVTLDVSVGVEFSDIDECALETHSCAAEGGVCANTAGAHSCTCASGYSGDGYVCEVDKRVSLLATANGSLSADPAEATVSHGTTVTFTAAPDSGYEFSLWLADCAGSSGLECALTVTLDVSVGVEFSDIDECALETHSCAESGGVCTNTAGAYSCDCVSGYSGDGSVCESDKRVSLLSSVNGSLSANPAGATVSHGTTVTFTAAPASGYEVSIWLADCAGASGLECALTLTVDVSVGVEFLDIDECATGAHACASSGGVCANTAGAYGCDCVSGYSGDGYVCESDKRVSLLAVAHGSLLAHPAESTVSHGTTVTFTAAPASGYEVSVWLADCVGASGLECALTVTLDVSVGVEFSDIDECALETHSCAATGGVCANTAGAYSCDCVSGYSGDGSVCESDKRVSLLSSVNGSLSANPAGATVSHGTTVTFTAAPASGYEVSVWLADCVGSSGLECALTVTLDVSVGVEFSDIDECVTGTHSCAAEGGECVNTAGSYDCDCVSGYSGDGSICESDKRVSLLATANGSLSADPAGATVSHGTTVTFTAAPASGYEVSVWLADCAGSSGLECALTLTVDVSVGVEFSDIDECATGTHSCASVGGECVNTAGGYDCDCVSGYSGDGSVCESDKQVSLLASANGSLSADPAGAVVSHGTTVTFTAAPASGYEVSVWLADCAGSSGLECALTVTLDVSVGVKFSDIDECALETHSCAAAGGVCTNTAGSYDCNCVSGYSGDGSVCEADKRVSLLAVANGSLSASPAGATVSHGTTVTFTAAPDLGYEVSVWLADCAGASGLECALTLTLDVSVGVEFSDIDECATGTHSCAAAGGVCTNTAGAYSCDCASGYSGDGSVCESDKRVSLLAVANGSLSADPAEATVSHGTTVTFTAVPASGYEVSVWLADCVGASGLECALTLTLDVSVGVEFSDIDECALETHSCAESGGVCTNTAGAYSCDCVSGYSGDGSVCESDKRVSLLASANGSLSASPAEATVSHGTTVTFTAAPASGYEVSVWLADCAGSSGLECALTLTVDVSVGVEFSDIDECATGTHSCAAAGGVCANTAGAYSCDCVSGYSGDGSVCESDKRVSLLAVANGSLSANPAGAMVSHGTTVTFTAAPALGYEVSVWLADCVGSSGLECALTVTLDVSVGVEFSDIDECATGTHSCAAAGGVCTNTAGAYSCDCVSGYSGDGSVCESDKRVSLLASANGSLSAHPAEAMVSHGTTVTFTAAPASGYEVSVWLADCAGASGLECALTLTLDVSVGVEFSDIDECAMGTHSCASEGGVCTNTAGAYSCDCVLGYSGDGSVCESDKRVSLLAAANGSLSADPDRATVSHGTTVTFTAAPASGYEVSVWLADCAGSSGLECALTLTVDVSVGVEFSDIDECALETHSCAAAGGVCTNTAGSYDCDCVSGYSGDGSVCESDKRVSLLSSANGSLSADPAGATVSHGATVTFTAAPASGYEVSVWLADCVGSSGLECALTVTVDVSVGVEFSDIDECATDAHSCAPEGGECANTAGAYSCDCVSGYSGDGYVCESDKRVSLLAAANGSLSANPDRATVSHGTTVTFTAAPESGYEVSVWLADCAGASGLECALTVTVDVSVGVKFSDIDECATGTHSCAAAGGVCANTAGAYSCDCVSGYSGDGSVCESDKRVSLLAATNGSLSADPAGATVSHGTTVTFTAAPASGYEVSVWLADCAESSGLECALTVTVDVSVGVEFSDIDECALETHSCAAEGGVCANTAGSYNCNCVSGYSGDGSVCESDKRVSLLATVNGSLSANPAGAMVSHGTTVTFTAAPDAGYEVSIWLADCAGASGLECALTVTLDVSVGVEFSDIDECALETHSCAAEGGECANTAGSYDCNCVSGYSGDGSVCESDKRVSLLSSANGSLSADPAEATMTHGTTVTFTAAPASGYEVSVWLADCVGSSGLECALTVTLDVSVGVEFSDIDECATDAHSCAAEGGECTNTAGAYSCDCVSGYSGDGSVCEADKRVSLLASAHGSLSANPAGAAVSHGATVTFTAAPASGYEVSVWLADCAGSSGLECALTLTVDVSVGVEFSDINECALETHSCAAEGGECANTAGSYDCDCVSGYSGDGSVCESDKRVSLLAAANGSLSANPDEATVTHGTTVTFTAAPTSGYEVSVWLADCVGASGLECALTVTLDVSVGVEFSDIDECATDAHSCASEGGVCANTAGAYSCDCVSGYSGDGSVCEADKRVSLLSSANGSLSADPAGAMVSHGTTVTFTAAPDSGYEFSLWLADCIGAAGRECVLTVTMNVSVGAMFADIDECATGAHDCANPGGRCENIPGGFQCECAAGFSGDGKTCEADKKVFLLPLAGGALAAGRAGDPDVKDGEAVPHGATVTFVATPNPGHHVSGWTGKCLGGPVGGHDDEAPKTCEVTVTQNTPVAATFADTDECDAAAGVNAHDCGANSFCRNEPGDFRCECADGFYQGAGRACEANENVCAGRGMFFDGEKCVAPATCSGGKVLDPSTNKCICGADLFDDQGACVAKLDCSGVSGASPDPETNRECVCDNPAELISLDGTACEAGRALILIPVRGGGTLSAGRAGDAEVLSGERVPRGALLTITATPAPGHHVYEWTNDCEESDAGDHDDEGFKICTVEALREIEVGAEFRDTDECDAAAAATNAHNCGDNSVCANTVGGFDCACAAGFYSETGRFCAASQTICVGRDQYFDGTKCADCDEVPETEPNAVGDKCVCKTDGHLIFGDASNRRCASPVICPSAEYAGGDCVPHPRDGRKLDAGLLYSPSTCEKIFGGLLEDEFFCSEIDLNDTFCLTTSAEALPCAGLYEHVRLCNSINRPALDPWHCGKVCEDGKMARGRKCETAEQN